MNAEEPDVWLARELDDHITVGSVGLYELIWLLNGSGYELTDTEKVRISTGIVSQILGNGEADLYVIRWPSGDLIEGPLEESVVMDPDAWVGRSDGTYIGLIPSDSR